MKFRNLFNLLKRNGVRGDWDGTKRWFRNGELHRDDGPAIEFADGGKQWWRNGQRHRDDGPAVEYANGTKQWWRNGQRHRENGPAVENADAHKAWYLNGKQLTADEAAALQRQIEGEAPPKIVDPVKYPQGFTL